MNTIAVVSTKGGVGKTTLASALAVRAAKESKRVALVDLDPMGSLEAWWTRRGSVGNPEVFRGADTASDAVEALALDGWDWVFIDTPPAFVHVIADALEHCDFALIPIRASSLDLHGSEDAIAMAREAGTPHLCVINDAQPRWKTTTAARAYLEKGGVPVAAQIIPNRAAYLGAMTSGKTGPEFDKTGTCANEIDALWSEVKAALRKARKAQKHVA